MLQQSNSILRLCIVVVVVMLVQLSPVFSQDVKIGTQVWMSKNLDVSTFRNGEPIPQVQDQEAWRGLKTGAWCYYANDRSSYGMKYGKLYNWYAVNDPRGLAPKGYHIPSDEEWTVLTDFLGGDGVAADKMKSKTGWHNYGRESGNGNNSSGFTGFPGGYRLSYGTFSNNIVTEGHWWSTTEYMPHVQWQQRLPVEFYGAWSRGLYTRDKSLTREYIYKEEGLSVRCLRD